LLASIAAGFLAEEGLQADYEVATGGRTAWHALKDGTADPAQSACRQFGDSGKGRAERDLVHFAEINQRERFFNRRTPA
jgi:hypothetical protein